MPRNEPSELRVEVTAQRLYDAEVALHAARQTQIDAWIAAASEKLHEAVVAYLDASQIAPRS